jgi:hypothetical protein
MTFRFLQRTSILFAVAVLTYACSAEKNPSGGGVINIGIGGNTANSGNAGQAGGASITSTDPASSQAGSSSTSTVVIRSDASVTVSDTRSVALDDCPGSLDSATVTALDRGATVDPSMKWLYPYDNTVFPGGLLAPILQWVPQSGGTQAIMLKMRSAQFSYRGCFGPADPAQLIIPQNVWEAAYKYQAPSDSLTVELTTKSGNTISGPIKETWVFARGKLRGDVYYSTYDSIKVNGGNEAMSNGAVMRIRPDQTEPEVLLSVQGGFYPFGPCISCHSVSANGGKMIASLHTYPMIANVGLFSSASYDLQKNPDVNPPTLFDGLDEAGFGALYPDGSRYMSNGSPSDSTNSEQLFYPYVPDNIYAMLGPRMSKLYDTATGQPIAAAG